MTDLLNATDLTVCDCLKSLKLSELAMVCAVSALVLICTVVEPSLQDGLIIGWNMLEKA